MHETWYILYHHRTIERTPLETKNTITYSKLINQKQLQLQLSQDNVLKSAKTEIP